jgi:hypothetical protein
MTWTWPVHDEWQEDRDCGDEDRFGKSVRSQCDGRKPGVIGELLQIPAHREVPAATKEGQRPCEALNARPLEFP